MWKDRLIYVDAFAFVWVGVCFVTWKGVLIFFLHFFLQWSFLKYTYLYFFLHEKEGFFFFYRWLHVYKNDFFLLLKESVSQMKVLAHRTLVWQIEFKNHFVLISRNGFILQIMQRRIWIQRYVTKVRPQFIFTK